MADAVDHPSHYGGEGNPYECILVIEAWQLGFNLGNAVKYISRAGKKHEGEQVTLRSIQEYALRDLEKAAWYLAREIETKRAAL